MVMTPLATLAETTDRTLKPVTKQAYKMASVDPAALVLVGAPAMSEWKKKVGMLDPYGVSTSALKAMVALSLATVAGPGRMVRATQAGAPAA